MYDIVYLYCLTLQLNGNDRSHNTKIEFEFEFNIMQLICDMFMTFVHFVLFTRHDNIRMASCRAFQLA
jgi:hypothetical protein